MMERESSSLRGKIAIVTGGSRGLGRNTVENLAKRGVITIFTYNSSGSAAEELAELLKKSGAKAFALHFDATKLNELDDFVERIKSTLADVGAEHFDFLINNAGVSHHGDYEKDTEEDLDLLYTVNFKAVFFLTQRLLPLIKDGGRIINFSSGLTRFAFIPRLIAYASSKASIEVFTRYLAKQLGPRGITVNTVAPGAIETDFSGGIIRDNPAYNKKVAEATAMGRAGLPDDIGPMIVSLLEESNRWVTAQRIEVSGGMVL